MPYKSPGARRTANREAQRRRRAGQAAEVAAEVAEAAAVLSPGAVVGAPYRSPAGASVLGPGDGGRIAPGPPHNDLTDVPGAIEDGPAPLPVDDGGFVTMRHRCTTCGVVQESAIPPIEGLGEYEVFELTGRCAQCARTPEAPDGPVLGPVDRGAVLRAPVEQGERPPYVAQQPDPRPAMAEVIKAGLAAGNNRPDLLVTDSAGKVRPVADVLLEDAGRGVVPPVDERNVAYQPNRHGARPSGADRELGPVAVDLPATSERAAVFVRRAPTARPPKTRYILPR